MEVTIEVLYNSQYFYLNKLPKTLKSLKTSLKSLTGSKGDFSIFFVNTFNSSTPILSSKVYERFIHTNTLQSIHLKEEIEVSSSEDLPKLKNNSKLKKRLKPAKPGTSPETPEAKEEEICKICYDKYKSPMQARCKHIFCLNCWEKTLNNYLECPLCKNRTRLAHLIEVSQDVAMGS